MFQRAGLDVSGLYGAAEAGILLPGRLTGIRLTDRLDHLDPRVHLDHLLCLHDSGF